MTSVTSRAAIYLRVSTDRQADADRFGLDVQAASIRQYAERHQLTSTDTYSDSISGTQHRREQLDLLLSRASAYDAVIISSVDRLGRRNRVIYTVLDELLESGLAVHSTDVGVIDPEDETSMLNFGVRSLFAESDHRRLVQKMYRAKVAKVAGNPLTGKKGRPANPLRCYGWLNDQPVPHERQWVVYMYQRLQTIGSLALARELYEKGVRTRNGTIWTPTKIRLLITNATYKGTYEFGRGQRRKNPVKATCEVEPFVSVELWENANRRMRERNARTEASKAARLVLFPLTGHVICGSCGRRMCGGQNGRAHYGYYICGYTRMTKYTRSGEECRHGRSYRAEHVNAAVMEALQNLVREDAPLTGLLPTVPPSMPDHSAALADVARRLDRLEAAYMAGAYTPDEYSTRRAALQSQRQSIENAPLPLSAPAMPEAELRERLREALQKPLPELADLLGLSVIIQPGGKIVLKLDPPLVT